MHFVSTPPTFKFVGLRGSKNEAGFCPARTYISTRYLIFGVMSIVTTCKRENEHRPSALTVSDASFECSLPRYLVETSRDFPWRPANTQIRSIHPCKARSHRCTFSSVCHELRYDRHEPVTKWSHTLQDQHIHRLSASQR